MATTKRTWKNYAIAYSIAIPSALGTLMIVGLLITAWGSFVNSLMPEPSGTWVDLLILIPYLLALMLGAGPVLVVACAVMEDFLGYLGEKFDVP